MLMEILRDLPAILIHSELQQPLGDCSRESFYALPIPSLSLLKVAGVKSSQKFLVSFS